MSRESVIKLIEAAENNPDLSKQLHSAQGPETVLDIAAKQGYQFTEAELIEVMQEKQLSFASDEALSEEQLESVVGGKGKDTPTQSYENTNASSKSYVNA